MFFRIFFRYFMELEYLCSQKTKTDMISFDNDYSNGAHPKVLQKLVETNELRTQPYGADECCMRAKELIKAVCED